MCLIRRLVQARYSPLNSLVFLFLRLQAVAQIYTEIKRQGSFQEFESSQTEMQFFWRTTPLWCGDFSEISPRSMPGRWQVPLARRMQMDRRRETKQKWCREHWVRRRSDSRRFSRRSWKRKVYLFVPFFRGRRWRFSFAKGQATHFWNIFAA